MLKGLLTPETQELWKQVFLVSLSQDHMVSTATLDADRAVKDYIDRGGK